METHNLFPEERSKMINKGQTYQCLYLGISTLLEQKIFYFYYTINVEVIILLTLC